MIESMRLRCPECNHIITAFPDLGEEALHTNLTVVRKQSFRGSWAEIAAEIKSGYGYRVLSLFDEVTFTLKNGKEATVRVIAENPYHPNEMIFQFTSCLGEMPMNRRDTNAGGWAECGANYKLNTEYWDLLPDDLKAVISKRTIVQKIGDKEYKSECNLWYASLTEVLGNDPRYSAYTQCDVGDVQFPGLAKKIDRIRDLDGETKWHFLRSPDTGNTTNFWSVVAYGGVSSYDYASYAGGVCPCFSIRRDEDDSESQQ